MSFLAACKKFFGTMPGQSSVDFAREVRALSPEDRAELAPMLSEKLGEHVDE